MNKLLIFILLIFIFSGCSSKRVINDYSDMDITYPNQIQKMEIHYKKDDISIKNKLEEFDLFLKTKIFNNSKEKERRKENSYLTNFNKISKFQGNTNE